MPLDTSDHLIKQHPRDVVSRWPPRCLGVIAHPLLSPTLFSGSIPARPSGHVVASFSFDASYSGQPYQGVFANDVIARIGKAEFGIGPRSFRIGSLPIGNAPMQIEIGQHNFTTRHFAFQAICDQVQRTWMAVLEIWDAFTYTAASLARSIDRRLRIIFHGAERSTLVELNFQIAMNETTRNQTLNSVSH